MKSLGASGDELLRHDDIVLDLADTRFQTHQQFRHAAITVACGRPVDDSGTARHVDLDVLHARLVGKSNDAIVGVHLNLLDRDRIDLDGRTQACANQRLG